MLETAQRKMPGLDAGLVVSLWTGDAAIRDSGPAWPPGESPSAAARKLSISADSFNCSNRSAIARFIFFSVKSRTNSLRTADGIRDDRFGEALATQDDVLATGRDDPAQFTRFERERFPFDRRLTAELADRGHLSEVAGRDRFDAVLFRQLSKEVRRSGCREPSPRLSEHSADPIARSPALRPEVRRRPQIPACRSCSVSSISPSTNFFNATLGHTESAM